jgi:hypothetical protein
MKRHLIAAVAALSVGLGGLTAAPAAAGDDEKALLLLLGLGAAGLIYQDAQRRKRGEDPQVGRWNNTWDQPGHHGDDWRKDRRHRPTRAVIPGECVYDIRTGQGSRDVVSRGCAAEFGLTHLPADCAFDIRGNGGTRTVYGARCLRDYGYRIEDARY